MLERVGVFRRVHKRVLVALVLCIVVRGAAAQSSDQQQQAALDPGPQEPQSISACRDFVAKNRAMTGNQSAVLSREEIYQCFGSLAREIDYLLEKVKIEIDFYQGEYAYWQKWMLLLQVIVIVLGATSTILIGIAFIFGKWSEHVKTLAVIPTAASTALSAYLVVAHFRDHTLLGIRGYEEFGSLRSDIEHRLLTAVSDDGRNRITREQLAAWFKQARNKTAQFGREFEADVPTVSAADQNR